jgi:hypothetical protein
MNNNSIIINNIRYQTGDKIKAQIGCYAITDAKIYVGDTVLSERYNEHRKILCFVCQNEVAGIPCPDKLGYQFSFAFIPDTFYTLCLEKVNKDCFEGIIEMSYPKR